MILERPKVQYPILVKGIIKSELIRVESLTGPELLLPRGDFPAVFENFKPFTRKVADGAGGLIEHTYFVCHLQKTAKSFSLRYNPFIYHWWKGWRTQQFEIGPDGHIRWLDEKECGVYWRTPGWRWQQPDSVSNWTPWILSGGRIPGTHLD